MAVVKAAARHADEIRAILCFGYEDNIITVIETYIPEFFGAYNATGYVRFASR